MEAYDYRNSCVNELSATVDELNEWEAEGLLKAVPEVKERVKAERRAWGHEWFRSGIIPAFKEYAKTAGALLEVDDSGGSEITVWLTSSGGFTLMGDAGRAAFAVFCLADFASIQQKGDEVVAEITFCPEHWI